MNKYTTALCAMALAGCSGAAPDTRVIQLAADGPVAETVNGLPVPQSLLEAVARARDLHLDKPEQREQALRLSTDLVLMAQAAQREKFDADPAFRADVEAARLKGVAEGAVAAYEKITPIGDDVVKAQYDSEVAQAGKFEYDFSQLLFADQADAQAAQAELAAGKPFAQVFDAWRGKAKQAKAFSRTRADQVPETVAKALAELKDGEETKAPVKSELGWHILHRDIANPFTPPPFEQIRDKLRVAMQVKAGQARLEKMREQAKVEYPQGASGK